MPQPFVRAMVCLSRVICAKMTAIYRECMSYYDDDNDDDDDETTGI